MIRRKTRKRQYGSQLEREQSHSAESDVRPPQASADETLLYKRVKEVLICIRGKLVGPLCTLVQYSYR
jgi:hypothetical protein